MTLEAATPVVFAGPSLYGAADRYPDFEFRPPARRGDLERAADAGARTLVLIDGVMVYDYPPSPLEVLRVLKRGVLVFGAASLGALRGVELRHHGMRASGWVYESFLHGDLDSDDEVVTPFDPRDGRPLGLPLVRLRYAVQMLRRVPGHSSSAAEDLFLSTLEGIYFEDRTSTTVVAAGVASGLSRDHLDRILSDDFDIKLLDAEACLRAVRGYLA